MPEKFKGELKLMVVGRCLGVAGGSGSGSGGDVVEGMLARFGAGLVACGNVYEAMGRLTGDASIGAVIVRLGGLGVGDYAFFRAVGRLGRGIAVYVDATGAEGEDVDRALSMGVVGVIGGDDVGASVLADIVGCGGESANGGLPGGVGDGSLGAGSVRFPWDGVADGGRPVRTGPGEGSDGGEKVEEIADESGSFLADGETDVMLNSGDIDGGMENVSGVEVDSSGLLLSRREIDHLIFRGSEMDGSSLDSEGQA